MRHRRIARRCSSLVLIVLLACAAARPAPSVRAEEAAPFAITHGPYLQLPSPTSMTIVWHTNRAAVSRVECWPASAGVDGSYSDAAAVTAVSAHDGLIDNDRTSHVIRVTGLRRATTYRYRVASREFQGYEKQHVVKYGPTVTSETFSFTTLDPRQTSYSVAVVSDIHENAKRLDAMLASIDWRRSPFVVFDGDMVNDFMNADQPFSGFLDVSVARFARTIPFVYVRGNHDVRGRFARRLADYFPPAPGGASGHRAYYSFDHGPVHYIVLDSGEDKIDAHEYYNGLVAFEPYRREQAKWLAEDLRSPAARRARYRVVLSHIPPYEGTSVRGTHEEGFAIQQVRQCWEAAANAGHVDLWLSGHTHRYAHVPPTPGKNRYHLVIGAPDALTRVDVSNAQLSVVVTRESGETLGTVIVRNTARPLR